MNIFESVWQLKVQIIPTFLSMLVIELIPYCVRVFFKIPYVPIYFPVLYPLNRLNNDVAIYLNDDSFFCAGYDLTERQLHKLKNKILVHSWISVAFSLGVFPFFSGLAVAFILPIPELNNLLFILVLYKLIGITRASLDFKNHASHPNSNITNFTTVFFYWLVYVLYFAVYLGLFTNSFHFVSPYVITGNYIELIKKIYWIFISEFWLGIVVVGLISHFFLDRLLNPSNRSANLYEEYSETPEEE